MTCVFLIQMAAGRRLHSCRGIRRVREIADRRRRASRRQGFATLRKKVRSIRSNRLLFSDNHADVIITPTFCFRQAFTKAVVLSLALATVQRLSGAGAIIQYTAKLFSISGSSVAPNTASIITGIFQLTGSGITIFLIDRVGRRILLLISSFVVVACLAMLTLYFYFLNKGAHIIYSCDMFVVCVAPTR